MVRVASLTLAMVVVLSAADFAQAGLFGRRGGCYGGSCSVSNGGCYTGGCSVSSGCYGGACAVPAGPTAPAAQDSPSDAPPAPPQASAASTQSGAVAQPVRYSVPSYSNYNYGRRGWFGRRGR